MAIKREDNRMICRLCGKQTRNGQDTCFSCHVMTCDSCFCECEPKQIAWRRANFWKRIYLEEPCGCNQIYKMEKIFKQEFDTRY